MEKIIVVAVSENGVIGKDGDIPWYYPEDMKHFKEVTMENPVLMGRKTFESLPEDYKPLPGRTNIVLTRSNPELPEEVEKAQKLEEAWEIADSKGDRCFIIGGEGVYRQTLDEADRMILTRIHQSYEGDTYFPDWEEENWKETERDEREELTFIEYVRND